MNKSAQRVRALLVTLATSGALVTALVAIAGPAAADPGSAESAYSKQAMQALHIRSVEMNRLYVRPTAQELRALRIRSEALNRRYGLDGS